ncbi:MAG: ATP-dependent DNA helicase RecG [Kiritimatiellae bacterium]|nr:ATP-dependent DNA helicase RecG [Kiritimatiellia bacterium]
MSDKTLRELSDAVGRFEPAADIVTERVPVGRGLEAIVCRVEKGNGRPYVWEGRAYKRVQSTTVAMPQEEYERMLSERKGFQSDWELQVNPALSMEDLDLEEIRKTARMGVGAGRLPETTDTGNAKALLDGFKVRTGEGLRNAAAVLFCKPDTDYAQCMMRLARFKGTDKSLFIDNKQVTGNIFRLLDAGMAFCFDHLALSGRVVGLLREERLEVPVAALREALVNALAHRLYVRRGTSVSLAIYDDRVEIANPGAFPPGRTSEDFEKGTESEPRNPVIARVLYLRKMLESWGRGIKLMVDECAKAGLPKPLIGSDGRFVRVVFARPPRMGKTSEVAAKAPEVVPKTTEVASNMVEAGGDTGEIALETALELALKAAGKEISGKVFAHCLRTLEEFLRHPRATLAEVAVSVGVSARTVDSYVRLLQDIGILERSGARKAGSWLVTKRMVVGGSRDQT